MAGEAADGREAVAKADTLRPDVVLMDVVMPGMNGLEATLLIERHHPEVKVLVLGMYDDEEYVQQLIQAGASGYVLKSISGDDFVVAIREVHGGSSFLGPAAAASLVEDYVRRSPAGAASADLDVLTARERKVLALIADGKSDLAVAEALRLSRKTVESHCANIMRKLGLHDVTGLVKYALRTGLTRLDAPASKG